jgi:outer membrane protein OmpA-like peptidoglycan-associated protein
LRVTVNSNQDGPVQPDEGLTLREAIALVQGTLTVDRLSTTEQAQVEQVGTTGNSRIEFNLPAGQTTIQLTDLLPDLERPGLVIDGTTQPGYQADQSAINELPIAVPIVAITPAAGRELFRGFTIVADGITIRGLSLYGFTARLTSTLSTPPADIFISHRLPPPDISKQPTPANFSEFYPDDTLPKDVVIENNWLGISPTSQGSPPEATSRSAFGVYVFNGVGTTIRRNWIANHDGSAIITAVSAANLNVTENVLTANGLAGMPDAIRLEGEVDRAQITGNLVCGNDGSGVYLFKPEGAVQIKGNQITYNGRRLRRAAVYLMGDEHQVTDNQIRNQAGPGVVVAAAPRSDQNRIQSNRFSNLEGLSIDLVTQFGTAGTQTYDFQRGDGPNPLRDTGNRRKDTGNAAINAPEFISSSFVALGTQAGTPSEQPSLLETPTQATPIAVFGKADLGTQIELYRVAAGRDDYGPLAEPIATAETDENGNFSATLTGLRVGEQISAIATHPTYGTSEPARAARIAAVDNPASPPIPPQAPTSVPRCTTPFTPPVVEMLPPVVTAPLRIQVPTNIHFALDRANISPVSARVLDRIAQVLVENPTILVDIEGHTDPRASDAYNLELGARRARAARDYLLQRGIAAERMTIRSLGETRRRTEGTTRLDFARDRRVEFIFREANDIEVIIQEEDLQLEGGAR